MTPAPEGSAGDAFHEDRHHRPLHLFDPIDSLFALAIREAERRALREIAYHPQLGYPVKIASGTRNPDDGLKRRSV